MNTEQQQSHLTSDCVGVASKTALPGQHTPELAPALETERNAALEAAARICETRAEVRFSESGIREPDTGACYYSGRTQEEYETRDEEDDECATQIRALKSSLNHTTPIVKVLDFMEQHGGGFVGALAFAWKRADHKNSARLMGAFSDIYSQYEGTVAELDAAALAKAGVTP